MFGTWEMFALLAIMLAMVFAGVHVAVALGIGAVAGIYMMQGDMDIVRAFASGRPPPPPASEIKLEERIA